MQLKVKTRRTASFVWHFTLREGEQCFVLSCMRKPNMNGRIIRYIYVCSAEKKSGKCINNRALFMSKYNNRVFSVWARR